MSETAIVDGRIENLDTDQIMPKQFLWDEVKARQGRAVRPALRPARQAALRLRAQPAGACEHQRARRRIEFRLRFHSRARGLGAAAIRHPRRDRTVGTMTVTCGDLTVPFSLSPRHRRMFFEGLDVIALTPTYRDRIEAFSRTHWAQQPWVRDVASRTAKRLHSL